MLRRGKGNKMRLIDVNTLSTHLGKDICSALIELHAWTGCDTVGSFAGQGKIKAFRLMRNSEKYKMAFQSLGCEWKLTEKLFQTIQEFTCILYERKTCIAKVNYLRYGMFRARKGDVTSGQLPPCEDALRQHTCRANYQSAIWRRSLENQPYIPRPFDGHGWNQTDSGLAITWYIGDAAPSVVLSLLVCKCPRSCGSDCPCVQNSLKCTPACKLQSCSNIKDDDSYFEDELMQDKMDCNSEGDE